MLIVEQAFDGPDCIGNCNGFPSLWDKKLSKYTRSVL